MAVVQISKIQIRRGQKNLGSGLPQLASGELGWAIDTRELYIGNGSVSEGAPAVGNTKILTEYDNIFTLADTYTYRSEDAYIVTGVNSSNPIRRTLQQRLDDRVSVRSFGAKGDGVTDDTVALQRAIDQIYINDATKGSPQSRVVLHFEAGTYRVSGTLFVPPYATLVGAGSDKTVIRQTEALAIFRTVNGSSIPGSPADDSSSTTLNQATNILVEGMTLENTTDGKALVLQSCKYSNFKDLHFKGSWASGSPITKSAVAIEINSLSGEVESSHNKFENCKFTDRPYAVISNWDINNNIWTACDFHTLGFGFVFGEDMTLGAASTGQSAGPSFNHIEDCHFENINRHALWIKNGEYNQSKNNVYDLVGNETGTDSSPIYSVIKYENNTNKSNNDYFSRTYALATGAGLDSIPYIPEIEGTAFYELVYENVITFGQLTNVRLFRLPGVINQSYEIDYTMVSETYNAVRSGKLLVITNVYNETVELSDNYHFTGDESYLESVEFSSVLRDADADLTKETVDVRVTSTMPVDDQTQFKFTIKAKKTNVN